MRFFPFPSSPSRLNLALAALAACFLASSSVHAQEPYKVIDTWKVGGTGGWDYLLADPAAHLLYLSHGPRVEVLDSITGKPVAEITGMKGTHGIALESGGKYGYITDGGSNDVLVFDRHTFATITTVPAGTGPDGIVFEPVTRTIWAFSGRSSDVTVIDTATQNVVATIKLPGRPEFPAADGKGNVYDNIESGNEIVRLDAREKALKATWQLDKCDSPSGLAIDAAHGHLFAVCDGKTMAVVDTATGKQIASATIGDRPDAAGFSPKHQLAFSSNGDGTLSVVDAAHGFTTIETLPTQVGARTMAYDTATDHVFVVTAQMGPRPAPTADVPRPRAPIVPDTFTVLVIARK